jgi:hypothetical protein
MGDAWYLINQLLNRIRGVQNYFKIYDIVRHDYRLPFGPSAQKRYVIGPEYLFEAYLSFVYYFFIFHRSPPWWYLPLSFYQQINARSMPA